MELRPLDAGPHQSAIVRLVESSPGGLPVQGLWRRSRARRALVPARVVDLVGRAMRRRALLAQRPLQRQTLSRLDWIHARPVPAGAGRVVVSAGVLVLPHVDRFPSCAHREDHRPHSAARCPCSPLHRGEPQSLSVHQPRQRRPHRRKPTGIDASHRRDPAADPLRHHSTKNSPLVDCDGRMERSSPASFFLASPWAGPTSATTGRFNISASAACCSGSR